MMGTSWLNDLSRRTWGTPVEGILTPRVRTDRISHIWWAAEIWMALILEQVVSGRSWQGLVLRFRFGLGIAAPLCR